MKIHFKNNPKWKGSIKYYISSFSFNDKEILNIDRSGRIISFITENDSAQKTTYKKAFDGSWKGIKRQSFNSQRERFVIPIEQIPKIYIEIESFIVELVQLLLNNELIIYDIDQKDAYFADQKEKIISFWIGILKSISFEQNVNDTTIFPKVYSSIGILPPDRYGSLVVQITIGCVYNKCVFCSLYSGIQYEHKPPNEVEKHINEIDAFIGESIGRFHSIFLGDANALTIPYNDLLSIFSLINEHYTFSSTKINFLEKNKSSFEGIYSFLDVFTGFRLSANQFRELKLLNLKMIYLGIESGSMDVLKLYNKPNTIEKILQLTEAIHQANVGIAVIFLIGAGGKMYEKDHIEKSIELIKLLKLNSNDIVYLSKLYIYEDSSFEEAMKQKNVLALTENELEQQFNIFKNDLTKFYSDCQFKPTITKYEILDFIY